MSCSWTQKFLLVCFCLLLLLITLSCYCMYRFYCGNNKNIWRTHLLAAVCHPLSSAVPSSGWESPAAVRCLPVLWVSLLILLSASRWSHSSTRLTLRLWYDFLSLFCCLIKYQLKMRSVHLIFRLNWVKYPHPRPSIHHNTATLYLFFYNCTSHFNVCTFTRQLFRMGWPTEYVNHTLMKPPHLANPQCPLHVLLPHIPL